MRSAHASLLVLFIAAVLSSGTTSAQDVAEQDEGPPADLVENFKRLSETKLAILQSKFGLSNEEVNSIREKMPAIIDKAARLSSNSTIKKWDDDLELKFDMAGELKPFVDEKTFESLRNRLELQLIHNNANAKNHLLNFIDQRVFLSKEQSDKVDQWLTSCWNSHWNTGASQLGKGQTQFFMIVRSLDQKQLAELLGEARSEHIFSKPAADINELINTDWEKTGVEEELTAALKQEYRQVIGFKLDEIQRITKLDDADFAKLRIAAMGASSKLVAEQIKVLKQKDIAILGFSDEKMAAALTQPGLVLPGHKTWKQGLRSILTDEQLKLVEEREAQRLANSHRTLINDTLSSFFIKSGINETAYQLIVDRVTKECDLTAPIGDLKVIAGIMNIEPEFWDEHLPKGSWRKIKTQLRLMSLGQ